MPGENRLISGSPPGTPQSPQPFPPGVILPQRQLGNRLDKQAGSGYMSLRAKRSNLHVTEESPRKLRIAHLHCTKRTSSRCPAGSAVQVSTEKHRLAMTEYFGGIPCVESLAISARVTKRHVIASRSLAKQSPRNRRLLRRTPALSGGAREERSSQ